VKRALLSIACFVAGCASAPPRTHRLESATFENENRYWAVGSSGRADLFDKGAITAWDYPMHPDLDDFYYEPVSGLPTASVHVIGNEPYLFTRAGDIFSFEAGWKRLAHRVPPERGDVRPQFDHVLVTPGDRVFIHVHSQVILSGTIADFLDGDFTRHEVPTFFTHMDAFGSRLFGIGWDGTGYVRQLFASDGGSFHPVVSLGRDGMDEMLGTLTLDDGSPVAVLKAGLVPGHATTSLGMFQGLVDTFPRDPQHVPQTAAKKPSIARVFAPAPGRALLVFEPSGEDRGQNVVELWGQSARAYRCDHSLGADPIGGFARERGFRVVTSSGRPIDVPGSTCRERNQIADDPTPVLEVPHSPQTSTLLLQQSP
jgi:hypothetical protein